MMMQPLRQRKMQKSEQMHGRNIIISAAIRNPATHVLITV